MRNILLLIIGVPTLAAETLATRTLASEDRIEIRNQRVKIVVDKVDGMFRETYYARHGSKWINMLQSGNPARPDPALRRQGNIVPMEFRKASLSVSAKGEQSILLEASGKGETIQKAVKLTAGDPFVHVQVTYECQDPTEIQYLLSTYSFTPDGKKYAQYRPFDFIFTPQLRPEKDEVIPDHTFRAPALMLQKGSRFAALIPDVASIDGRGRPIRAAADVQLEASDIPLMSFGLWHWKQRGHTYYFNNDTLSAKLHPGKLDYGFLIYVTASAAPHKGFQEIVRFHWNELGHQNILASVGPQSEPFSSYITKAWYGYVPQVAMDVEFQGKPVTLLRQNRLAWSNKLHKQADNDNWFNVWFNSLRTAYGMFLHAKETGDNHLKQQALGNLNLALLAPQKEGIAPSIFYYDSSGGHWVADHAWGGIDGGKDYAMFHNAWTNYWLLEWIELVPERRKEILAYARSFADFLVRNQKASGVIPSWYDPETLRPAEEFRDENAETAGAAFFLAEFYGRTRERTYLQAAERAMQYIFTNILPERKWFDYETFFSCSRKPLGFFDRFTGQHPQNTLSIHQAAEACYALYQLTGKKTYKDHGIEIMDYLCLYQQVWSPKWLSRELFGGFGVQNTDGEWSDSRQGYFAVTLMKYYELTGKQEYFERGVAALRSMFSLFESADSPRTAENYAHISNDELAGVTGLHWGTGSSVVSIHLIRRQYGDAFVNVKGQWGVGIDGCRIPKVTVKASTINVEVLDNIAAPRSITMTFGECSKKLYTVVVNGKTLGTFSKEQLRKGIDVAI